MIFLVSTVVAVMTFFLVLLFVMYARYVKRRDLFSRLEKYHVLSRQIEDEEEEEEKTFSERMRQFLTSAAEPFTGFASIQAWDIKMRQAGIPLLGGEFLVVIFLSIVLASVGTWMLTLDRLMAGLAGAIVILLFWLLISLRIGKRQRLFISQLGDALTTISNALRAGYSFPQSMDAVAREMEAPISEEFFQVTREVAMGMPLENSLEAMNKRMGSSDFDLVVTAVVIQREVGGNLAQILDTISDTIAERIRLKREMYTLTAQGRLSAKVIFSLPFAIALFVYCLQPSQILILFEHPLGRTALGVCAVLNLIGIFVIKRILDIKV